METRVRFESGDLKLAGLFDPGRSDRGVVITHPHPLYGGDMGNVVVETVTQVYQRKGFATLRFNFRGVGGSAGRYDDGAGERSDVVAAMAYLREQGVSRIDLAGYSFGAWVNARLPESALAEAERLVMVSPPVNFLDFDSVDRLPNLALVVAGDEDDFADEARLRAAVGRWRPDAEIVVIPRTDHFYGGALRDLADALAKHL